MKVGQIIRLKIKRHRDLLTGRTVEQLSDGRGDSVLPYFTREVVTPDNRGVLVSSNRTGQWLPYLIVPDEQVMRCLSATPLRSCWNPAIGGDRVVSVDARGRVGYVPLAGGKFQAIVELPRGCDYSEPGVSACGRYALVIYSEKLPAPTRRVSDGSHQSATSERIKFGARTVMLRVDLDTGLTKGLTGGLGCFAHPMISPADANVMEYCAVDFWHEIQRMWTIRYHEAAAHVEVRPLFRQRIGIDAVGHELFLQDGKVAAIWTSFGKVGVPADQPKESFILVADPRTGKHRAYRTRGLLYNHLHGRDGRVFVSEGCSTQGDLKRPDLLCRYDVRGSRTVRTELCMSGCSWKGQLGHPHAVLCRQNRWCYFNSDHTGRAHVYRVQTR